jgi:hypothetical protein
MGKKNKQVTLRLFREMECQERCLAKSGATESSKISNIISSFAGKLFRIEASGLSLQKNY